MTFLQILVIGFSILLGLLIGKWLLETNSEGFADISNAKNETAYKEQLSAIVERFDPISSKRRGVTDLLSTDADSDMPPVEQCFVNFYSLGCRFAGYLGPFQNGYFDYENAILYALKAGCRTFIYEIDYIDNCIGRGDAYDYYPRLIVRDINGRVAFNGVSGSPQCNSDSDSSIRRVSNILRENAFSSGIQNNTDPLIIVLYLLRLPPREKVGNKRLLTYYSRIAKGLTPLLDKGLDNVVTGGTFARQAQEGLLLTNPIKDYTGRVLFFCNADTSPFRAGGGGGSYAPNEDLDYIVNLRLSYKQTQLGCTADRSGGSFGGLETADSYMTIPPGQVDNTCDETKLRWTVALSADPSKPVNKNTYEYVAGEIGVHCLPISLWDTGNGFMFEDTTFGTYSFMPKPKSLRFTRPPIAVPAQQAVAADAKGGVLRSPVVG
jgi:hypothetical protein